MLQFNRSSPVFLPATPGRQSPRPSALALSLLLHLGLAGGMLLVPGLMEAEKPRVAYIIRPLHPPPEERQVLYLRPGDLLPEISPAAPSPVETPVRAELKAKQQITASPQVKREGQFVWTPPPSIPLQQDLVAPNIVVLEPKPISAPPAPPSPKVFQPPPAKGSQAPGPVLLPVPEMAAPAVTEKSLILPAAAGLRLPEPGAETGGVTPAPPTPTGQGSPQGAAAVILGPTPADVPFTQVPEGVRAGRIAAGGEQGGVTGGGLPGGTGQIVVPDLSIRGGGTAAGGATSTPGARGEAKAIAGPAANPAPLPPMPPPAAISVSAPLWPNSRVLPPMVEARFRGRVVYSTVLVLGEETGLGEGVVVWFSDHLPTAFGARVLMRPPMPSKTPALKTVPARGSDGRNSKTQLAGVLRKDGRLESLAPMAGSDDALARALIDTLQHWEFVPAIRNGSAVDVDVIIEVTLQ